MKYLWVVLFIVLSFAVQADDSYLIITTGKATLDIEKNARKLFGSSLTSVDKEMSSFRIGIGKPIGRYLDVEVSGQYFGKIGAEGSKEKQVSYKEDSIDYGFYGKVEGDILAARVNLVPKIRYRDFDLHGVLGIMYVKGSVTAIAGAQVGDSSVDIDDVSIVRNGLAPLYGVGVGAYGFVLDVTYATDRFKSVELGYKFTW